MCRGSAAVKLLASESVNIRRTRVRVPASAIPFFFFFFFFFFFNIHTSDKLEIFFGGRIFSDSQPRSQDAILLTMAKALCTGQRHYNMVHYNYHI